MSRQKPKSKSQPKPNTEGITRITVAGFKSISQEQSIEIRPLTILAGPHGSGKSSIMQPLLLLKQTLEANYDPGALLLDGPNVKFTAAEQLLSRIGKRHSSQAFQVGLRLSSGEHFQTSFRKVKSSDLGSFSSSQPLGTIWERIIQEVIHLPGLRGNRERVFPVTAIGPTFPGTFEKYMATR